MNEVKQQCDCEIIQDLLPLYQDDVCSESSRKAVEEHLIECEKCREIAIKLKNTAYDNCLSQEKNNVLGNYVKKERKRSTTIGIVTASILMIPVIVCLICNIAIGHALDWFFIVLASLMLVASLTVVPMVVYSKKILWTLGSFTVSLILLLLVTCIYSRDNWFFLALVPIIFGLSVIFMPYVIYQIKLPVMLRNKKGLFVMLWDTFWLFGVFLVCSFYTTYVGYWHDAILISTFCLSIPWLSFLCIRYLKAHPLTKAGFIVIIVGIFLAIVNDVIDWILGDFVKIHILYGDFSVWDDMDIFNSNIYVLILGTSLVIGGILIFSGIMIKKYKRKIEFGGHNSESK